MTSGYETGIMSHAQTPKPLLSLGLQQDQSNTHVSSDHTSEVPVAPPPLPSVSVAPMPSIPPHREWEDIATLELPAIMSHFHDLRKRCTTTRDALNAALIDLETFTQIFLSKHAPISSYDKGDYLNALANARVAGRSIFAPQEAYRSAITTLGLLVSDLIDVVPVENNMKEDVRARFNKGMSTADQKEEGVRKAMRGLADGRSKGYENFALVVYLDTAKQRSKNWYKEEKTFKAWAEECISELRHGDEGWLS